MQYNNHSSISYSVMVIPPTNYISTFIKPFSFVWYIIPLLKTGFLVSTRDFFLWFWQWKHKKPHCSHVPTMLSSIILAQWQHPVASSEALDLLHWAMHAVMYRCMPWPSKWPALQVYLLIVVCMPVALAATGAIQSKNLPNANIQWLPE